jgi:hypothetical protein
MILRKVFKDFNNHRNEIADIVEKSTQDAKILINIQVFGFYNSQKSNDGIFQYACRNYTTLSASYKPKANNLNQAKVIISEQQKSN